MKLAIMQPYLFPYLGYFQLIHSVDRFVFYNDVDFIKRGWINRNRILVNGRPFLFTVPVKQASQNRKINKTRISPNGRWQVKLVRTIDQSYRDAPGFTTAFPLIESVLTRPYVTVDQLSIASVRAVAELLGLTTSFDASAGKYDNEELSGADRVLDICRLEGASSYVNMEGGSDLYDRGRFEDQGVELRFLKPVLPEYDAGVRGSVGGLSIIDVLMHNPLDRVRTFLEQAVIG